MMFSGKKKPKYKRLSSARVVKQVDPKPLPSYFDSDSSSEEIFTGFLTMQVRQEVPEFAVEEIQLKEKVWGLFEETDSDGEFLGFTRQEMYV